METTLGRFKDYALQLRPFVRFHPYTGRLWLDCLLLLVVGALHATVLPTLAAGVVPVDLMTPWLVTTLVLAPLPRGAFLALVGALIVETHSAAPAGLYVVAYWVVAAVLYLTRSTLSWRHAFPWLVTLALAELWVIGFETFVLTVNASQLPLLDPSYLMAQFARLLLSVGIGMVLCRRLLAAGLSPEETP